MRQDYAQALKWSRKSANQDNADAQFLLGLMYSKGNGVKKNAATAKEYFGKSCDNGLKKGCDGYRSLN